VTPTPTFVCSICSESSTRICIFCTKDACENHLCAKCGRCSDCCECDLHSWRGRTGSASGQTGRKNGSENESHQVPGNQQGEHDVHLP